VILGAWSLYGHSSFRARAFPLIRCSVLVAQEWGHARGGERERRPSGEPFSPFMMGLSLRAAAAEGSHDPSGSPEPRARHFVRSNRVLAAVFIRVCASNRRSPRSFEQLARVARERD
jgi:hypothetical protein